MKRLNERHNDDNEMCINYDHVHDIITIENKEKIEIMRLYFQIL